MTALPSRSDAVHNRRAILDAAGTLVLKQGDFSMSELARAAGLTRPTLYRHFSDRDHVIDALAHDIAPVILERLLETFEGLPLDAAFDRLAADVVEVAGRYRHMLEAGSGKAHDLARRLVPGEPIKQLLEERRDRGELRSPLDVGWIARAVRALCLTAIDDTRPPETVRKDLAGSLRALTTASPLA
jgi:AcrR family transcriptional regulator